MEQQPNARPDVHIHVPADRAEGHYADFATVWHTDETFVLDFATMTQAPTVTRNEQGQPVPHLEAQVCARVRIRVSQVRELMKTLEKQLGAWETEQGRRPSQG